MWGAEERGRVERAGSFNSEVKHVVVGGARDLREQTGDFSKALSL